MSITATTPATSAPTTREGDPVATIEVQGKPRMAGDTESVQVETMYEYADGSVRRNGRGGTMVKLTKAQRASIADLPRQPYAPPEAAPEPEATPAPEPEVTPKQQPTVEVFLAEATAPRHFWPSLADGGQAVAEAFGVDAKAVGKTESLVLTSPKKADLDRAHKAIIKMWNGAVEASKTWRKADEEYKAADTNGKWRLLNAYLRAYAQDVAGAVSSR